MAKKKKLVFKPGLYLITGETYERHSLPYVIRPRIIKAESLKDLVKFVVKNYGIYVSKDDVKLAIAKKYNEDLEKTATIEDLWESIVETNGDGADYINIYPVAITGEKVKVGKAILE